MSWAQRLKRVFNIDISTCDACGGAVKFIASIEDPQVIKQILSHLEQKATTQNSKSLPESRAPPASIGQVGLFDWNTKTIGFNTLLRLAAAAW